MVRMRDRENEVALKPLAEQVIVIIGASSGIGLATARLAAEAGANVVLAARNGEALDGAVEKIRANAGRAIFVVADASDPKQLEAVADEAIRQFGRIDTWINNAAVAVYGRIMDVPLEDMRRQFDINYWGQVHGSRIAVRHLREQGGALINVASALADRAIPLQGNYCASKHALKAFTDSLRMELEADGIPISVSLVKPGSIDTPLFDRARTYLPHEPQPIPPVYAPDVAARAILACATRPIRDVITGGMGKVISLGALVAPRFTDRYMERRTIPSQMTDVPSDPNRPDNLHGPVADDGHERGRNYHGRVRKSSLYTAAELHPRATLVASLAALASVVFGARIVRRRFRR